MWFAHWTPGAIATRRFATWFFVGAAPEGRVVVDDGEIREHLWIRPADAIARRESGEIELIPPTWVTLHKLADASSTAEVVRRRRRPRPARSILTHITRVDGGIASIWQGDAAYDDLDTEKPGPRNRLLMLDSGWRLETSVRGDERARRTTRLRQHPAGARIREGLPRSVPALSSLLHSSDLRWARRMVILLTAIALLAVACGGGGDDGNQAAPTTVPADGSTVDAHGAHHGRARRRSTPSPACRGVPDPSNLYSEIKTDNFAPATKGALTRVYVPNRAGNTVSVIDPATMKVVDTFDVGLNPQHVVPSYDLSTLWVTNNAEGTTDGTLTPIDPKTGKPGQSVTVDDPYNMYFTPDGKYAINVAEARKRLDFLDPHTMKVISSLDVPGCDGINHADFTIDGKYVLFTCEFGGAIAKIDVENHTVVGYLQLSQGGMPQDIR